MGISKGLIKTAIKMYKDKNLSGNVVTYGVQGIQTQYDELLKYLIKENYKNLRRLDENKITMDNLTQLEIQFIKVHFLNYWGFQKLIA